MGFVNSILSGILSLLLVVGGTQSTASQLHVRVGDPVYDSLERMTTPPLLFLSTFFLIKKWRKNQGCALYFDRFKIRSGPEPELPSVRQLVLADLRSSKRCPK